MPEPVYPTDEGIWASGTRTEPQFDGASLGTPYPKAVANLRRAIGDRDDFDPAVLLVWGTMQATGVLNILEDVEEAFGDEGQAIVRKALKRAGHEAMTGLIENSTLPEDIDPMSLTSYLVTGMNTIIYASLERPWITDEGRAEFDILWCPHQDRYSGFDCRVQRYFVEGMIEAVDDAELPKMTGWVETLIPMGFDCCHFVIEPRGPGENPWHEYSDRLGTRALEESGVDGR